MTKAEWAIDDAKEALDNIYASPSDKAALSLAIADAEKARAHLADVKNHLVSVIAAIENTLEDGLPRLALHAINDEHYSKVTTAATAGRFRAAMAMLRNQRQAFDRSCEESRRVLLNLREAV